MKKTLFISLVVALLFLLCGCREAGMVSHNFEQEPTKKPPCQCGGAFECLEVLLHEVRLGCDSVKLVVFLLTNVHKRLIKRIGFFLVCLFAIIFGEYLRIHFFYIRSAIPGC